MPARIDGMKTWFTLLLLMSATVTAGCSSSAAADHHADPIVITQFGDSTVVGYHRAADGTYPIYDEAPWKMLQADLRKQLGSNVQVRLYAKGGATIRDLVNGTGSFPKALAEGIKDTPKGIVTVKFGLNDPGQMNVATFQHYLTQAVEILVKHGDTIVLEEPTPTKNNIFGNGRDYAVAVDNVAAQFHLPLVRSYDATMAIPGWQGLMSDEMHPTLPLYRSIVAEQLPVLLPTIKKVMGYQLVTASKR